MCGERPDERSDAVRPSYLFYWPADRWDGFYPQMSVDVLTTRDGSGGPAAAADDVGSDGRDDGGNDSDNDRGSGSGSGGGNRDRRDSESDGGGDGSGDSRGSDSGGSGGSDEWRGRWMPAALVWRGDDSAVLCAHAFSWYACLRDARAGAAMTQTVPPVTRDSWHMRRWRARAQMKHTPDSAHRRSLPRAHALLYLSPSLPFALSLTLARSLSLSRSCIRRPRFLASGQEREGKGRSGGRRRWPSWRRG